MKNVLVLLLIWLVLLLQTIPGEAFERFDVVSTQELQELLEQRRDGTTEFLLLNTLDEIIYKSSSIPGSINIPWGEIDTRFTELGENKERLIITYCIGHR